MGEPRVLPIDNADFFERPPPPGRSRESSIVLDAEGRFWEGGELVVHRGMQDAFAKWIRRHPRDGRYILCNGYDWTYFRVADVPYFVRRVASGPSGVPLLVLSDETEEPLEPSALRVAEDHGLYTSVKGGREEARFTPAAQLGLAPYVVEGPGGEPALCVAERLYVVPARDRPASAPGRGPNT